MKSTMKKLTALILVLVLTLSLFAGCSGSSVKTSDEYLLSEYGMTFSGSSATYDGSAHSISVSATTTSGYSVSYSYLSGSTEVSTAGVTDAGTYEVVATITETDGEIFYLSEDITISPASLSVSVPDQYIRTGSDASDVEDVFTSLSLKGSDTVESIGMEWDVANIDDIDAMDDVSDGKALGVTIESDNYTLSVTKGTLYVLSYADYTAVTTLLLDVSNLEAYGERFDELSYTENSAYISAAGRVLDVFENEDDYTSIQVAMMGSVSQSSISSNLVTAQARKIQGYELDWDVANDIPTSTLEASDAEVWGAVNVVAQYYGEKDETVVDYNDYGDGINSYEEGDTKYKVPTLDASSKMWVEDDDDDETAEDRFYIDNGFLIDYDGRDDEDTYDDYEESVRYGDYFYFVMKYYDNDDYGNDYLIEELIVRNKEVSYDSYTLVYKTSAGAYTDDEPDNGTYTTFVVYKLRADSTTVGALGAGTTIDITIQDIPKYNVKFDTTDTDTSNGEYSSMVISGDTNGTIFSTNNLDDEDVADSTYFASSDDAGYVTVGEEVSLTLYMKDGYYISEVYIGEYIIDGSDFVDNKVTFTVEEDMFDVDAGGVADIEIYTGKSYDVSMKINSRTVRSTTGEYEGTTGTVEIDGAYVSGSTVYVIEGTTLDLTFSPNDNYEVSSVKMYFDAVEYTTSNKDDFIWDEDEDDLDTGETYGASIELIDEVYSNEISIDLSDDCDYFDFDDIGAATSITFEVTFAESWTFSVESDDVVFKENAAGEFVSDYGTISVLDYDEEIMTTALNGDYFMLYAELEPGYIISSIKVNNSSVYNVTSYANGTYTSGDSKGFGKLSDYAAESIDDGEMYFFSYTADVNTSDPSFGTGSDDIEEEDLLQASYSNLDGGEAIVIEIEFDTYYELSIDNDTRLIDVDVEANSKLYKLSSSDTSYVIFGDDDSSKISIDLGFDATWWAYYCADHTGWKVSADSSDKIVYPGDTSDQDKNIDRLYYYFEVEGEVLDDIDFKGSTFNYTSSYASGYTYNTSSMSLDFDDLMALVDAGDEIIITIWYDVEYD